MSDEKNVASIELGEDGKVELDEWKKSMPCFLCNKKVHIKEDCLKNKKKNNKESPIV